MEMKEILNRMLNHEELSREETKNILVGITKSEFPNEQITAWYLRDGCSRTARLRPLYRCSGNGWRQEEYLQYLHNQLFRDCGCRLQGG